MLRSAGDCADRSGLGAQGGVIRIVIIFPDADARALTAMAQTFRFEDSQFLLRHRRNIRPDNLSSAVTRLITALTAAGATVGGTSAA